MTLTAAATDIRVTPTTGLVTSALGDTATFSVVLSTAPTDTVTIPIASTNAGAGTASVTSLTFTPGDYDQPQTVTVTGGAATWQLQHPRWPGHEHR